MNDAILLSEGTKAMVASIVSNQAVSFSKFRIGSSVNYTPDINAVDVENYVYEGDRRSMRWYLADNPEILVIELTIKSSAGDFDVGNVMVFDNNNMPFCYGVRLTPIPKLRTTSTQVGSELIITMAVRILSNTRSSAVTVYLEEKAVIPVVATAEELLATEPDDAGFPVYVAENFKETNIPALVYADESQDEWWVNRFFMPYRFGRFNVISGGYVGDTYSRPFGALRNGGEFGEVKPDEEMIIDGGTFGDEATYVSVDGGDFGE